MRSAVPLARYDTRAVKVYRSPRGRGKREKETKKKKQKPSAKQRRSKPSAIDIIWLSSVKIYNIKMPSIYSRCRTADDTTAYFISRRSRELFLYATIKNSGFFFLLLLFLPKVYGDDDDDDDDGTRVINPDWNSLKTSTMLIFSK